MQQIGLLKREMKIARKIFGEFWNYRFWGNFSADTCGRAVQLARRTILTHFPPAGLDPIAFLFLDEAAKRTERVHANMPRSIDHGMSGKTGRKRNRTKKS
jgi:citrate lyase beta subunit